MKGSRGDFFIKKSPPWPPEAEQKPPAWEDWGPRADRRGNQPRFLNAKRDCRRDWGRSPAHKSSWIYATGWMPVWTTKRLGLRRSMGNSLLGMFIRFSTKLYITKPSSPYRRPQALGAFAVVSGWEGFLPPGFLAHIIAYAFKIFNIFVPFLQNNFFNMGNFIFSAALLVLWGKGCAGCKTPL